MAASETATAGVFRRVEVNIQVDWRPGGAQQPAFSTVTDRSVRAARSGPTRRRRGDDGARVEIMAVSPIGSYGHDMAKAIEDLLHRRNDLSTFLVHLTRDTGNRSASDNLLGILANADTPKIEARSTMGMAKDLADRRDDVFESQKVVCFSETPLEHIWMMCEEIENRDVRLQPYGVVFTKTWARRKGVNPVMYFDISQGAHEWLTKPVDELVRGAETGSAIWDAVANDWRRVPVADAPILKLTPFFEQMGKWNVRKEFWWEREWRKVGDLYFNYLDLVAILAPEPDHARFHEAFDLARRQVGWGEPPHSLRYLDPTWGLERMIAALAGVRAADVGPFPA